MKNKVKIPPGINPKKIKGEAESRKNILEDSKVYGCHEKVVKCFARYDEMLAKCNNEEERKQVSVMGAAELYRIMGLKTGLSVDGVNILPSEIDENEVDGVKNKA